MKNLLVRWRKSVVFLLVPHFWMSRFCGHLSYMSRILWNTFKPRFKYFIDKKTIYRRIISGSVRLECIYVIYSNKQKNNISSWHSPLIHRSQRFRRSEGNCTDKKNVRNFFLSVRNFVRAQVKNSYIRKVQKISRNVQSYTRKYILKFF